MANRTRTHRNQLLSWAEGASDAEVGRLVKHYLAEAAHGRWEGWDRHQIRTIMELLGDMNLTRLYG